MAEPPTHAGWVSERLREELPELGLALLGLELEAAPTGRSPAGVRTRLGLIADRFYGADALVLRQRPVPQAYRVFFRQIGLDPDVTRVPAEAAALERLLHGGLPSRGLLADALTIAVMETGVPVLALDADAVVGRPGLRLSGTQETLGEGEQAAPLPAGRIVIGDERGPVALLFGDIAPEREPTKRTRRLLLAAVRVEGVAQLQVEEALWACAGALASA